MLKTMIERRRYDYESQEATDEEPQDRGQESQKEQYSSEILLTMKKKKILFIPNTPSLLRHLSVLIYYNG